MKKIGIVGGVGWRSTVDYYRELCRRAEALHAARGLAGLPEMPEMGIESLDLRRAVALLGQDGDEDSWLEFDAYHRAALRRLEASGADFAILASNTPHARLASIRRGVAIPVLSSFDAVASACARIDVRRVLILGTAVTMGSPALRSAFADRGIEAAGPGSDGARAAIVDLIARLQLGEAADAADLLGRTARAALAGAGGAVCLACTELPLAFPEAQTLPVFEVEGVVYVNTTAVHVAAAFELVTSDR